MSVSINVYNNDATIRVDPSIKKWLDKHKKAYAESDRFMSYSNVILELLISHRARQKQLEEDR